MGQQDEPAPRAGGPHRPGLYAPTPDRTTRDSTYPGPVE
jgi:hypothetical protein